MPSGSTTNHDLPYPESGPATGRKDSLVVAIARISRTAGSLLGHEALPRMAAALAYRTIFSLIPILLLAFLTLRLFKDTSAIMQDFLGKMVDQIGLAELMSDTTGQFNLQVWISQRVADFSGMNFTGIGLVSAVVLIYAAISLLVEVETSFNMVYGARRGRPWANRIVQYWMLLSLGPLAVYASFFAGDTFRDFADQLATDNGGGVGPFLLMFTGYLTTVLISATLLMALYFALPFVRVNWRAALMGALAGAVLLELAKTGFTIYLRYASFKSLYGSLALLPLFLLWVYITWLIVLFGLRLSFLIQHGQLASLRNAWRGVAIGTILAPLQAGNVSAEQFAIEQASRVRVQHPMAAVAVASVVARSFWSGDGKPVTIDSIAMSSGVSDEMASKMMAELERKSVVVFVGLRPLPNGSDEPEEHPRNTSASPSGYVMAKPPSLVTVEEVLDIGQHMAPDMPNPAGAGELARLHEAVLQAQRAAVAGKTLADLCDGALPVVTASSLGVDKTTGVALAKAPGKPPDAAAATT